MSIISTQTMVVITVEVPTGTYNPASSFASINEQAGKEGTHKVAEAVRKIGGRVVGEPSVKCVTILEERP